MMVENSKRTFIVDGMVVQGRKDGGQERLLKQIGHHQLLFQNVPYRFGRFILIIGLILRVILKQTRAKNINVRRTTATFVFCGISVHTHFLHYTVGRY